MSLLHLGQIVHLGQIGQRESGYRTLEGNQRSNYDLAFLPPSYILLKKKKETEFCNQRKMCFYYADRRKRQLLPYVKITWDCKVKEHCYPNYLIWKSKLYNCILCHIFILLPPIGALSTQHIYRLYQQSHCCKLSTLLLTQAFLEVLLSPHFTPSHQLSQVTEPKGTL